MDTVKKDIIHRDDAKLMVDNFYEKVKHDPLLAPVFAQVDWPHHLPIMYDFWSSMLLGDQTYTGNPLQKHLPLPLQREHFDQWLALFTKTIDETFSGEKAEEAKDRARNIAGIFQLKMGLTKSEFR